MFVPLHDINNLKKIEFQYVTVLLILLNVAIFVFFQSGLVSPQNFQATMSFALVPAEFLGSILANENTPPPILSTTVPVPEFLTVMTYMFLHGSWWHLGGNMLFLWVFGDNVEDAMGHFPFLIFYFLCGIAGGVMHSTIAPDSGIPLIGASGAVSGVIAAYLLLHPNVRVWVLVLWRIPLRLSAIWVLGFWIALQFFYAYFVPQVAAGNTAWHAHVGGILAGTVLILFMRRRGVHLFSNKLE